MDIAVIAGASSGIGAATARQLALGGYKVILVARNRDALEKVAGKIGPLAIVEPCDATDGDAVLDLASRILRDHGVPNVLVNIESRISR